MIELIQFPWSPFCLVQRRILEYSGNRFRITNVPPNDRSLVWRLTRQRYYGVPIIRDGKSVVFETEETSQVIAKYLDDKLGLGLFPRSDEGVQAIVWRYIENDIEGVAFKLNDIYYEEFVRANERLAYLRHKERKFGPGCLLQWRRQAPEFLAELAHRLILFEEMLVDKPYLLGTALRFVDFDLYGMLANYLYSGHYELPPTCPQLKEWYQRIAKVTRSAE